VAKRAYSLDDASLAYELIRRSRTDVAEISGNTGYKIRNVEKVKRHLFLNTHLLDRYVGQGFAPDRARFDPDMAIARAWHRLRPETRRRMTWPCCDMR